MTKCFQFLILASFLGLVYALICHNLSLSLILLVISLFLKRKNLFEEWDRKQALKRQQFALRKERK